MILFAVGHLLAGLLVGARYRVAALLIVFGIVAIESVVADVWLDAGAWYLFLAAGIVAAQLGYAAAAVAVRSGRTARSSAPLSAADKIDRVAGR